MRAAAHLHDRSGWRTEGRVVDGLDGVDHDDGRAEIIARSGLGAAVVMPALLGLELKGMVQQLPGKVFVPTLDPGSRATKDS
ncbi:MAG: hypothetical protein ACO3D0_10585 [Ilumatobacteraceae bacterium]